MARRWRVVQFLRFVHVPPAGIARRMVMGEVWMVFADGADEVAFHDLHVVDVVEQADARRADQLADLDTPGRVVALVARMIHLAVQQFDHEGDTGLFRGLGDAAQAARSFGALCSSVRPSRRSPLKTIRLGI